jgi:hypothetical protein
VSRDRWFEPRATCPAYNSGNILIFGKISFILDDTYDATRWIQK